MLILSLCKKNDICFVHFYSMQKMTCLKVRNTKPVITRTNLFLPNFCFHRSSCYKKTFAPCYLIFAGFILVKRPVPISSIAYYKHTNNSAFNCLSPLKIGELLRNLTLLTKNKRSVTHIASTLPLYHGNK